MSEKIIMLRGNGDFTVEQFLDIMEGKNEKRLMLSLGLTTGPGCNMDCIYCYNESGRTEAGRPVRHRMKFADYEKAILESSSLGAQSVILVGVGETMMDKNFRKLIELISTEGMIPLIFTNGTLLTRETANFLYKHGTSIYLALDSTRENVFDKITGSKGMLPVVLQGVDNCLEAGFGKTTVRNGHSVTDFAVNTMLMKSNMNYLDEIEDFCQEKGLLFTCRFPEKIGAACSYWESHIAATVEEENLMRNIAEKHSAGGEVFRTDSGCLFWMAGVLLGIDGQVRLCYSVNNRKDMGNIKQDSMRTIIRRKRELYPPQKDYFCPLHLEISANP
ncbi:MAG: radical SAM protein [Deltaproteobacteria bacterium]|nr:radical SAM protein [Deltaproteobacteria bacterium]